MRCKSVIWLCCIINHQSWLEVANAYDSASADWHGENVEILTNFRMYALEFGRNLTGYGVCFDISNRNVFLS